MPPEAAARVMQLQHPVRNLALSPLHLEPQRRRNGFETCQMKKAGVLVGAPAKVGRKLAPPELGARPHRGMVTPVKIRPAEVRDVGALAQYVRPRM